MNKKSNNDLISSVKHINNNSIINMTNNLKSIVYEIINSYSILNLFNLNPSEILLTSNSIDNLTLNEFLVLYQDLIIYTQSTKLIKILENTEYNILEYLELTIDNL